MPVRINNSGEVLASCVAEHPDVAQDSETVISPGVDLETIKSQIGTLTRVYLPFASHTDGRGLSQARLLRSRYGFTGVICATGSLAPDLLPLLKRCGVDEFVIDENAQDAARALLNHPLPTYQPSVNAPASIGLPGVRTAPAENPVG